MRWPFGPPHLTLKPSKKKKNTKKTTKKQKQKNKGGFRAKWGGPLGHLTWPLNPPKKQNTKKQKKNKTKKTQKNRKKNQNKERKSKKHKNTKKKSFSVISQNFLFFWQGIQKLPFFDTLAQKTRTQKHYKNRGFSLFFFGKKLCVTKRPFLDKKTQIQKFQLSFFFLPFFSFKNKKTQKSAETPIFIVF